MSLVLFPAVEPPRLEQIVRAAGSLPVVNAIDRESALDAMPGAVGFFGKLTPELLAASKALKWVQTPTVSLEHYMFPELVAHRCVVTNMRGLFSDVIADHVMGFVLSFCRNLHLYVRRQLQHHYEPVGGDDDRAKPTTGPSYVCNFDRTHRHVADQTLGVVGVGEIGAEICRRASAFGMTVLGVDPKPRNIAGVVDVWPIERLDEMLGKCDFVVIAAPHTPQTAHLFDAARLSQMKPNSFLINIGRGAIVELNALTEALRSQHLAGAALDVFEVEPLPGDHPLWDFENVLITPHIAAASPRIAERHLATLLENIRRFVNRKPLLNIVNKAAWY